MLEIQFVTPLAGHDPIQWDPNEPGAMEKIRKIFDEKLAAGFMAFALFKDGTGQLIQKFNEEVERIVLIADKIKMVQPSGGG